MRAVLAERFNFSLPKLKPSYPEQEENLQRDDVGFGVTRFGSLKTVLLLRALFDDEPFLTCLIACRL